jgi:hypothetical protein
MKYHVWSIEHTAWWKPNKQGYTRNKKEAGIYTQTEAFRICRGANLYLNDSKPPNEALVPMQEEQKND